MNDDILPEDSQEVVEAKLTQIAELLGELFPCTEGWSYEVNLENAETGIVTGITHDPHELFEEYASDGDIELN